MIILVDTREQAPYLFGRWDSYVVKDALPTGDYSLLYWRNQVAVERKSLQDFYLSIGRGRSRFFNTLERMSTMVYKALVIEARMASLVDPSSNKFTKLHDSHVWGALQRTMLDLHIPVIMCEGRSLGEEMTYKFLLRANKLLTSRSNLTFPAFAKNMWVSCSLCSKNRIDAINERPDLGLRNWLRVAVKKNPESQVVLGHQLAVCYDCRARINKKEAVLPDGYEWER